MDLGKPHGVESKVLGRFHLRQGFVEGDGLIHAGRRLEFREEAELHVILPRKVALSYTR